MNRDTRWVRAAVVTLGLASLPVTTPTKVAAQNTSAHSLTVTQITGLAFGMLTTPYVDAMFQEAGEGTQTQDSLVDVSCSHGFQRNGGITPFSSPPGYSCASIGSNSEMSACMGQPGFLKIVDSITACGAEGDPGLIGCNFGLPTVVLERGIILSSAARGPLLNHEFGHAVGLGHAYNSPNNFPQWIMNWIVTDQSRQLTTPECSALRSDSINTNAYPVPGVSRVASAPQASTPTAARATPATVAQLPPEPIDLSDTTIEELAHMYFIDRSPHEAADYYTQGDVDKLVAMLNNPVDAQYKQSIAALIAIISDGRSAHTEALLSIAGGAKKSPESDADADASIVALGMMANKGSLRALQFLLERADDSDTDRADVAIAGLGLSARPEALAKLQDLRNRAKGTRANVLDESLRSHSDVAKRGLRAHFGGN